MFSKPRLSRFPILWRRFTGAVMGLLLASVVEAQTQSTELKLFQTPVSYRISQKSLSMPADNTDAHRQKNTSSP
jgi:hypothetical protein